MFKSARRKSEKNKTKALFKLQLKATKVPQQGWEELVAALAPTDTGRPTARSEKALIVQGSCHWPVPIYEEVRLARDPKSGKIDRIPYRLLLSAAGSGKSEFLGEIDVNLADYAESFKPSFVSLPLKAPNADTILHITLQRVDGEAEGRETDENGDSTAEKDQRRTLRSQLLNSESDELREQKQEEETFIYSPASAKQSSRTTIVQVESNGSLGMLDSFEGISASGSSSSSGSYTPKENGNMDDILDNCTPLSSGEDGSHQSDGELEKLKNNVTALTRQLEVSKLELQTLRKQVVKESRKVQDLSRELQLIKNERDELARECEELKASKKNAEDEVLLSAQLHYQGKDFWSILEETKQELNHEKKTNANISLQLKKTRESNSELILAVRDLEELLEQNKSKICSCGSRHARIKSEEEIMNQMGLPNLCECKQEFVEQYAHTVDAFVKEVSTVEVMGFPDQNVAQLTTELELYKKEREELEMHMEQLALDYEILKQENHIISIKLEQMQLREQLRMQYENSAHFTSISDLENQIGNLEKELVKQEEAFQADLGLIIVAKVELEKRAIQAEEALQKTKLFNRKTAQQLQNEFKGLMVQMSCAFRMNEELMMEKLKDYNELQLQKSQLDVMLQKKNEEVEFVRHQHHLKCQQLVSLIDFKTKEVDSLHMELKEKCKELEDQRLLAEASQRPSMEQIARLQSEIENLEAENDQLFEQIKDKEILIERLEQMKTSTKENKLLEEEWKTQRSMLEYSLLKEEATKSMQESNEDQIIDNGGIIRNLNAEKVAQTVNCSALKCSMLEDELAKENPRQQVVLLRGDSQKATSVITNIDNKLKGHKAELTNSAAKPSSTSCEDFKNSQAQEQLGTLHEKATTSEVNLAAYQMIDMYGDTVPILEPFGRAKKEFRTNGYSLHDSFLEDKTLAKDLHSIVKQSTISDNGDDLEDNVEKSVICTYEQKKTAQVLREMVVLKEQNHIMERELKEMQERYSEMSLRFAEVEGERQNLVIKIRSLKNALKI